MQKLRFVNGNGVELDLTSGHYGITNWSGFSNADLTIQGQQVPFQDGEVFLDALYNPRELSVTLAINDNNNLALRYELKRELISVMNAKLGEGYLYYKNDFTEKRIKVVPQLPIFENKNSNDAGTLKASLSWTAPEVYWEDVEESVVNFNIGTLPEIQNSGDVPVQIKADIFSSNAKNPALYNMSTNKKIEYLGTLTDNQKIDTSIGQKKVVNEVIKFDINSFNGNIYGVCYSSKINLFVGVSQGVIFSSYDGITWTSRTSGVGTDLRSVIYSDALSLFVVVGSSGRILTSTDGITWTSRTSGVGSDLNGVTYSDTLGLFVVVGDSGRILTSTDGTTWTSRTSGVSISLRSVTYSDTLGLFVVVGFGGRILTSPDGVTWTSRTSGVDISLRSVTYSDTLGLFVVVGSGGRILTSTDGITWTSRTSGVSTILLGVTYSDTLGLFVVVGLGGVILTSTDGITWTSRTSGVFAELYGIIYSDALSLFVVVGSSGVILTSTDGITWTSRTSGVSTSLLGVTYSDTLGLFVVVGFGGTILLSDFQYTNNQINKITTDSDMNLNLQVGKNKMRLGYEGGFATCRITYRQKYLGV